MTALAHMTTTSLDEADRLLNRLAADFIRGADVASIAPAYLAEARALADAPKSPTLVTAGSVLASSRTTNMAAVRGTHAPTPIIEKRGDLFAEPGVTHLAHCISADCKLGAGIAKTFVAKFGPASFRQRIAMTKPVVGGVAIVGTESGQTVYNLVTKRLYYEKPTLPALIETLLAMRAHARANDVRRIAMPRIGCGLDALPWPQVREALQHVFGQSGIQIVVVELGGATQAAAPQSQQKRERESELLDTLKRARSADGVPRPK